MHHHQEKPNLQFDRVLCIVGALAALLLAFWLLLGIRKDPDITQPWRFFALVGAVGLAAFLGWTAYAYVKARYVVDGSMLRIEGGLREVQIPLGDMLNLYRWRQRWIWSGASGADLGVDHVTLVPNTLLRMRGVWVLVYRTPDGDRRAVGILPSPKLLSALKGWTWERKGKAVGKEV